MIPFTYREMSRACREAKKAATVQGVTRTNAHRLLLFYSAECGLKAAYMKRNNIAVFDGAIADNFKHNLNRIMGVLRMSSDYMLQETLKLRNVRIGDTEHTRNCGCGELNQVWRYGGVSNNPTDDELEKTLEKILAWIAKELN